MRLTVIGTGNVAAALLVHIAQENPFSEVRLIGPDERSAIAIAKDAASAFPDIMPKISYGRTLDATEHGIVVLAAGAQIPLAMSAAEVLAKNAKTALDYLTSCSLENAKLVVVSSPVDRVTELVGGS